MFIKLVLKKADIHIFVVICVCELRLSLLEDVFYVLSAITMLHLVL